MNNFIAVFLGGGLGALCRYILYLISPDRILYFPFGTLIANFLGCFIATILFSYFALRFDGENLYKIFLITGFCGGLSTLSALSLEVLEFIQNGEYMRAGGYILTSLLICTISVILGVALVKKYV